MKKLYLVTDVGSTTTKAILIGPRERKYRLLGRGEHPTTVEARYEDVTVGVIGALEDLGNRLGISLVRDGTPRSLVTDLLSIFRHQARAAGSR